MPIASAPRATPASGGGDLAYPIVGSVRERSPAVPAGRSQTSRVVMGNGCRRGRRIACSRGFPGRYSVRRGPTSRFCRGVLITSFWRHPGADRSQFPDPGSPRRAQAWASHVERPINLLRALAPQWRAGAAAPIARILPACARVPAGNYPGGPAQPSQVRRGPAPCWARENSAWCARHGESTWSDFEGKPEAGPAAVWISREEYAMPLCHEQFGLTQTRQGAGLSFGGREEG